MEDALVEDVLTAKALTRAPLKSITG